MPTAAPGRYLPAGIHDRFKIPTLFGNFCTRSAVRRDIASPSRLASSHSHTSCQGPIRPRHHEEGCITPSGEGYAREGCDRDGSQAGPGLLQPDFPGAKTRIRRSSG